MHLTQRGLALPIVLTMLAAVALVAASLSGAALSGVRASAGLRAEATAQQLAEAALRYCETQLLAPSIDREPALQEASLTQLADAGSSTSAIWRERSAWTGQQGVAALPAGHMASETQQVGRTPAPLCRIDRLSLNDTSGQPVSAYLITARGFSPDYRASSDGLVRKAGAEVWLQSQVVLQAVP